MNDVGTLLQGWHDFYFMAGGASAGLIGIMFVAISLGLPLVDSVSRHNFNTFATPSVIYFGTALLLACTMLAPSLTAGGLALIMIAGGLFGIYLTYEHIVNLVRAAFEHQDFVWGDWLAQIILPTAAYLLIPLAGLGFLTARYELALLGTWFTMISLLVSGIANTWSLVVWIIDQRKDD